MIKPMTKVERIASGGLRYLFAPQLTGGLRGIRTLFASLVQTLAQTLMQAQLIPVTHRALNPMQLGDIRLGDVLCTAYANLRTPGCGKKADQYVVFGAVVSLLALTILTVLTFIFKTFIGAAQAALTYDPTDPGACVSAAYTSIFNSTCANDMAQQWIDMLLLGNTTNWFAAKVTSLPLAAGLASMFGIYSVGMLILAGFLVLYHMLSIVAETANEGRVGGRSMNHVWAPLRLVMAVGMLIPIGGNTGLNSGQFVVAQVAKWGSGLASNAWSSFVTVANNSGSYVVLPPIPTFAGILKNALKISVCEQYYNGLTVVDPNQFSVFQSNWSPVGGSTTGALKIMRTWDGLTTLAGGKKLSGVCGSVTLSNPEFQAQGTSSEYLSSSSSISAVNNFRKSLLITQKVAFEAAMNGPLRDLAEKIVNAVNANTQYKLTETDTYDFLTAVENYRISVEAAIIAGANTAGNINFAEEASSRGWISAGAWFNSIAKINGLIIDAAKNIPSLELPKDSGAADRERVLQLASTLNMVDESLRSLATEMSIGTSTHLPPEDHFTQSMGVNVDWKTSGNSVLDRYLETLSSNWNAIIGSDAGSMQNLVTGASGKTGLFQLNTANPLAELSAMGNRIMDLAITTMNRANTCSQESSKEMQSTRSYGKETKEACGSTDPSGAFMISMLTSSLLVAGLTLAFVLPLMPFIRFMFGLITWIVAVFEAVVAIPLIALAHIKTDGEGLSGSMARSAYMLVLQIFARPILMIFGLVIALLVFNLIIVALNELFTDALRSVEGGGTLSSLAGVVYSVIYACLAYGFANAAFKAIDLIPNQALQWIGGHSVAGIDESYRVSQGVGQLGGAATSASSQMMHMRSRTTGYLNQPGNPSAGGGANNTSATTPQQG